MNGVSVNMIGSSQEDDEGIERIFEVLDIRQIKIEQVVSKEEWSQIDSHNRSYENIPRTWAAIHATIGNNFQSIDLRNRLKSHFQTMIDTLCRYVGIARIEIQDREMRCYNNLQHHLNPGSHSAMTCVQQISTCPQMSTFNQRCVAALNPDVLEQKCRETARDSCQPRGKCALTGYTQCAAMKSYFFDVCVPVQLVTAWEGLKIYKQEYKGKPIDGKIKRQLKQIMVSIVIQAFTVFWGKADRN